MQGEVAQASGACGADAVLGLGPPAVRSSSAAIGVCLVLVARQVRRMPSASVRRNWALGCGRSFPMISRIPLDQPVRQSPSSSATQAPSRISPSGSTAGVQADAGTFRTVWWMASVMVMPTE